MTARLIGLDWGTSSLRAWLMAEGGAVLDEIPTGPGILAVPGGDFDAAFEAAVGPWLAGGDLPVIASGMITSRNGWVETPYLPLPLDAGTLASALTPHRTTRGRHLHFVTGAIQNPDYGLPDVMRGEETEIIGHLADGGPAEGTYVLPGTHSKWARTRGGRLTGFHTCMTGEVFALLRQHSILGRLIEDGEPDPAAFRHGVAAGRAPGTLLARAFSARTLVLTGRLAGSSVADYLSGLLIGDEVAAMAGAGPVTIIGRGDLAARYQQALAPLGVEASIAAPGMARAGLWEIATRAGIV